MLPDMDGPAMSADLELSTDLEESWSESWSAAALGCGEESRDGDAMVARGTPLSSG
jgi:hypothetical protein